MLRRVVDWGLGRSFTSLTLFFVNLALFLSATISSRCTSLDLNKQSIRNSILSHCSTTACNTTQPSPSSPPHHPYQPAVYQENGVLQPYSRDAGDRVSTIAVYHC